jgi:hypothetical protein
VFLDRSCVLIKPPPKGRDLKTMTYSDISLTNLEAWGFRIYRHIIDWVSFNAYELNLKYHPERCATHLFLLKLRRIRRAAEGEGRKAKKMFKVVNHSSVFRPYLEA